MIGRGVLIFTLLASHVQSLPVTQSHLENEDVQVMKCIVEVLTDVLSRPRPLPVSQLCLDTLSTDDRLVTILRHRNFLKELQAIAAEGTNHRAQRHGDFLSATVTQVPPQTTEEPDQSMLEASLPADQTAPESRVREEEEKGLERDGGSRENHKMSRRKEGVQLKKETKPFHHISDDPANKDGGEAAVEEKRLSPEVPPMDAAGEEHATQEKTGLESNQNMDGREQTSEEKKSKEEEGEVEDHKRSAFFLHDRTAAEKEGEREAREEGQVKQESGAASKRRSTMKRRTEEERSLKVKGKQEAPRSSKEAIEKAGEEEVKSSEVKQLQLMARRPPEEKRAAAEEEGSASQKGEDPEIESLATIESELESVAQKIHELRRG